MASPWKFIARLTARLRHPKDQQDDFINDVKSNEAAEPKIIGATIGNLPKSGVQRDERGTVHQSDVLTAGSERYAEDWSITPGEANLESAKHVKADDPSISGDAELIAVAARDLPTASTSGERPRSSAKRTRSPEATNKKLVQVSLRPPLSAPTFSDEAQSLDEEITVLRGKLAHKLRLQNAQLRFMLNRFER